MSGYRIMPTRDEDPDAWREVLGATDVVAVLGLSPYRSPLSVWLEKRGEEQPEPSAAMKRGLLLESVVATYYEHETGRTLAAVAPYALGVLAASPDRYTIGNDGRLVEIKTHSPWVRSQYGEAGTGDVPPHIAAQLMAQVALARRTRHIAAAQSPVHDVAAFFGDEFATFTLQYDAELGEDLLTRAEAWWERHIVGEVPPEVGAQDSDWIARTFSEPRTEEIVQADAATEDLIAELRQATLDTKAATARKDALSNRLKVAIGEAAILRSSCGQFTYRLVSGGEIVDAKALRERHPDVYAEVAKARASSRRLSSPRGFADE
jgi:putative phage-type endonuclease